ncbi:MAG: DUF4304 domain-containing protein [Lachnospiraceae bacterium]|nr:DUF4304 domain-containing protein [Lachnospiraceae bacterium]
MTKEERVIRYFELASTPEYLPYDTGDLRKELNITEEDISGYRQKLESELSYRPVEKRDIVVKQVIKPALKKCGFSTSGLDWRRETEDAYIIIHMQNSQCNDIANGAGFRFYISASKKDEIREKLSDQWMYNQGLDLKQFDFLPYCGMLSPYYSGDMYKIDGYKDYLPTDTPIEDICRQIGEDFETYILPPLCALTSYEDFQKLRADKLKRYKDKEIRLLRYYHAAQTNACELSGIGYHMLVNLRKVLELDVRDIESHLEWLTICRENSRFTKLDATELAIRASKEERE